MPKRKAASRNSKATMAPEPTVRVSLPQMPESYQLCDGGKGGEFLPWSWLSERLVRSRNYWVASARPDGRPHVMPVWGIWMDNALLFSTDRRTRKARNLAANPATVVNLESGDEAVILEGATEEVKDKKLLQRFDDVFYDKYKMRPSSIPGDVGVFTFHPRVAFAWWEKDFNRCATRWQLEPH